MRRQTRPHPLHSFKFWFLILIAAGATIAWKLDLLPVRDSAGTSEAGPDAELGDAGGAAEPGDPAYADVFSSQSEPSSDAPSFIPDTAGNAPRAVPSVAAAPENPFGNANPEFVPVQGHGVNSDAGVSGDIVLANAEEADAPDAPATPTTVARADATAEVDAVDFSAIDALLEMGTIEDDIAAHRALSEMYWQQPDARPQLAERIERTARRIYFQPQPHYMEACMVLPGDNLQGIAKQYSVTAEYLARLNRIEPDRIRAGQSLKVIKGPFNAVVDLSDYEITIHCHGYYVYRFPVGVGKDESSPIGTFTVQDKVVNPPYYGPEGAIAADDPSNPIGERWISIGDSYGIHGTIDPESIGKNESRGCIRMHNEDVEIVYDLLTIGSEVVIQR
jgi:lipoprotein-anchoring transpeptidase ErfK/SrfK